MWIIFLFIAAIVLFTFQNITFKQFSHNFMANADSYFMFSGLYFAIICAIFLAFGLDISVFTPLAAAVALMFAVSFVFAIFFYMKAMEYGPLGLSFLFFSAGMLWPILFGIIVYNQPAPLHNGLGLVLLFIAFYISTRGGKDEARSAAEADDNVDGNVDATTDNNAIDKAGNTTDAKADSSNKTGGKLSRKWIKYIVIASCTNGIIGIAVKLFRITVSHEAVTEFLFLSFGLAAIIALITGSVLLWKNKRNLSHFRKPSFVWVTLGTAITTAGGNYTMVALTLLVSALLQFPVINGALVITSILVSRIVFKERVTKNQLIAIGVGLGAILLLSL